MWWFPIIFYNLWWLISLFLKLHTIHVQKQGRCTLEIILTWLEILNWSLLPPMLNTSPPQFLRKTPSQKEREWFGFPMVFFPNMKFRDFFQVMLVFFWGSIVELMNPKIFSKSSALESWTFHSHQGGPSTITACANGRRCPAYGEGMTSWDFEVTMPCFFLIHGN